MKVLYASKAGVGLILFAVLFGLVGPATATVSSPGKNKFDRRQVRKPARSFAYRTSKAGRDVTILGSCSGLYSEDSNSTYVLIPDYPGSGDPLWTYSDIEISDAPSDAIVTCVSVGWTVYHSWPEDLYVSLSDYGLTNEYILWEFEYATAGYIGETVTGITLFNGELVNQVWTLWAADFANGDTGNIDDWWIKVYYEDVPGHCTASSSDCDFEYISNVEVGTISNSSGCDSEEVD